MNRLNRMRSRVVSRLQRLSNVRDEDISPQLIENKHSEDLNPFYTIDFYFASLGDLLQDDDEMFRPEHHGSSISVTATPPMVMEWTIHLPLVHDADADVVEEQLETAYERAEPTNYEMLLYATDLHGAVIPHIETPTGMYKGEETPELSVAEYFDTFDAVVGEFGELAYEENRFFE